MPEDNINYDAILSRSPMSDTDKKLYLSGSDGLAPYLRLYGRGMPSDPIEQIAWLLLNGSGCGFCKTCRPSPCNTEKSKSCTKDIADYIRKCVKEGDGR